MGKMTDREKHIKNLSCIMDSMPDDACGDWRDSLAYAISSLKIDEAYQIMYEGGEVFTKDNVVDMLKDLKKEIALLKFVGKCQDVIQQKINELEEIENHDVKPIEATPQLSEADSEKIIKEVSTKPNYRRIQKLKEIVNKILLK